MLDKKFNPWISQLITIKSYKSLHFKNNFNQNQPSKHSPTTLLGASSKSSFQTFTYHFIVLNINQYQKKGGQITEKAWKVRETNHVVAIHKLLLTKAHKLTSGQIMSSFQRSRGTERPARTTRPLNTNQNLQFHIK